MSMRDLSIEDEEGLSEEHASRVLARQLIDRHRYPASNRAEAVGGMRGITLVITLALGALAAALIPVGAAIVRNAPAIHASALHFIHRFVGWLA